MRLIHDEKEGREAAFLAQMTPRVPTFSTLIESIYCERGGSHRPIPRALCGPTKGLKETQDKGTRGC